MNHKDNQKIKFHPNFIFRVPLYPFLKSKVDDLFTEAIYITSPSLKREYEKYLKGQIDNPKEIKKLQVSYYKYLSRASSRCTPFGLFAGLGTGQFDDSSAVVLHSDITKTIDRRTRPDMNVLCVLAKKLSETDFIRPYLNFFPNTSIYKIDLFYRYVEYYYVNNKRIHKISKVDFSVYLESILEETIQGKTISELTILLTTLDKDINEYEALDFITELIQFQILISDFEPTVTGNEFFEVIVENLEKIQKNNPSEALQKTITYFLDIKKRLLIIDQNIVNSINLHEELHDQFKELMGEVPETNLFQTDLFYKPQKAVLDKTIQNTITNTIDFLNKITPSFNNANLDDFKKRFQERYQDAEISILEALDVENGIGYLGKDSGINDLIDDLIFPNQAPDNDIKFNSLHKILFDVLLKSHKEDSTVVNLNDKDFKDIDFTDENLPHTMTIKFNLLDVATGKILLDSIGGASASTILGRFGHGNPEISSILNDITQHEKQQANDNILAEIIHLPENRMGNILSRPAIREYEIAYLAKSNMTDKQQIKISDLYVSVKNGAILLRSKLLNKQIIPRLSNAHNYSYNALPIYHFLCDMQAQYYNKSSLYFSWGTIASNFTFLPRVEYKNVVLKSATWQLNKKDYEALITEKSDLKIKKIFQEFTTKFKLPELFLLVDGDNELLINTADEIAIFAFIDAIKNRTAIILEEFLFNTNSPLIKDENNNGYTNECLAIVLNQGIKTPSHNFDNQNNDIQIKSFLPGSQWLYFKIYCGIKTADYILTEKLFPISEELLENGTIQNWFFIRYADPDNHLRFRIQLTDTNNFGVALSHINQELEPLHQSGLISKILIDTYDRELERYGHSNMETSERLFHSDSIFCASVLSMLDPETGNEIRWHIALRATDKYLDDFDLTLEQKEVFTEKVAGNFFNENNGNPFLKKQLNEKYRTLRNTIEDLMTYEKDQEREILPLLELLAHKTAFNQNILKKFIKPNDNKKYDELLFSYIHMMHNRLFNAKQRQNEFIIYELLSRHYKSVIARKKYEKVSQNL
jgi:lantibiotic biosynthesis protein